MAARAKVGNTWVTDLRAVLPVHPDPENQYGWRQPWDITGIAVHHTGVVGDMSAEAIAKYHITAKGYPGAAYHFLLHPGGRVEYIGDILTVRYHVAKMNPGLVGICLAGDFRQEKPKSRALRSLYRLIANLQYALGAAVGGLPVKGHKDWAVPGYETTCPGRYLAEAL